MTTFRNFCPIPLVTRILLSRQKKTLKNWDESYRLFPVIPAKAGIQVFYRKRVSGFPFSREWQLFGIFVPNHYTPVNASWLNQVEIVLSVITRQCISKRIGSINELKNEIKLWAKSKNNKIKINWNYKKENARRTFHKHYVNIA